MTKAWMVHAGNTELQVPHHVLYQHSIECNGVLYYFCAAIFLPPQVKKKRYNKIKSS
jgi:hypothetical protein